MGAGKRNANPGTRLCLHPLHDLLGRYHSAGRRHQKELVRNAIQVMNANAQRIKFSGLSLFVLFIAAEILLSMISLGAKSPKSPLCGASEYHGFDFWIGDWDAFDFGTFTKEARVRVDRILDGCVIHEEYQSVDGHKGESFSIYDDSRKVWHQTWVTNRGQLLIIEGKMQDGAMVLAGIDRTTPGDEREVRGIWRPVDGGVRETAFTSTDGGKTWKPWFDLMFRPHK
jgi:hypothetical protein